MLFIEVRVTEDGESLFRSAHPFESMQLFSQKSIKDCVSMQTVGMRRRNGRLIVDGKELTGYMLTPVWRTVEPEDLDELIDKDETYGGQLRPIGEEIILGEEIEAEAQRINDAQCPACDRARYEDQDCQCSSVLCSVPDGCHCARYSGKSCSRRSLTGQERTPMLESDTPSVANE